MPAKKKTETNDVVTQIETALEKAAEKRNETDEATTTGCDFMDVLEPVANAMSKLDEFSQGRMLQDIGRGLLGSIGWNRAFKENILYGNYESALALQGGDRAEDGTYIGAYGEQELDAANGMPITSIFDTLSPAQLDLLDDVEDKEDMLWDAFDAAETAYTDLQGGGKVIFLRPSQNQRKEGIKSIEDMVEAQKRFAMEWNIKREQDAQSKRAQVSAEVRNFREKQRAERRATRSAAIVS